MINNRKNAFTLVELLAVIVILAIILVIAVPKVMNIINDTKKSTFAASVKLIASGAEKRYAENKALGNTNEITCKEVAKLSSNDYKLCEIVFEKEEARVTVIGDGKFDGLSVVYASKTNAEVQTGEPDRLYTFDEVYDIVDNLTARIEDLENNSVTKESLIKVENKVDNFTNKDSSNNIFLQNYPVGSVYVSTESANPGTKFGGTWVAFGAGRTLVGVDSSQEEFATIGKTGGEKEHTLTIDEMPSHNHEQTARIQGHSGWPTYTTTSYIAMFSYSDDGYMGANKTVNSAIITHGTNTSATGSSQPHNNLQPYITVYMWKRTT